MEDKHTADASVDVADDARTGDVQSGRPRMVIKASCEPSRMTAPSFEQVEMATIAQVTHADKDWNERKSFSDVKTLCFNTKATSAPELTKVEMFDSDLSHIASETYSCADKPKMRRSQSMQMPREMNADDVDYTRRAEKRHKEIRRARIRDILGRIVDRLFGILDIPLILVFGIMLYIVDVASDVTAGIVYYEEGHPVWASLTITCVVLSAVCWAAVSWTWWYYSDDRDHRQTYRRVRMMLALLLLDPLVRQCRVLWFTCRREYCKSNEDDTSDSSSSERSRRQKDPRCSDYWQKLLDVEESTAAFLTAIATLVEDCAEITLQLYIIVGHGVQENTIGYIQLVTSLGNIFYTTAQFPRQVRLQKPAETQIKTCSMATVTLFIWRTLVVGSRILAFVLFASLFKHWLFVVVGCHYFLTFAFVFYQLRSINKQPIARLVYNIVTPFIYVFDFCVNWLEGPTRYWYIMVYVPLYCENVLMSALGLWYASTTPSPSWYIVPGCVCVIGMFPLGILVQLAYYRYWHPKAPLSNDNRLHTAGSCQPMSWSDFQREVNDANDRHENRGNLISAACL